MLKKSVQQGSNKQFFYVKILCKGYQTEKIRWDQYKTFLSSIKYYIDIPSSWKTQAGQGSSLIETPKFKEDET